MDTTSGRHLCWHPLSPSSALPRPAHPPGARGRALESGSSIPRSFHAHALRRQGRFRRTRLRPQTSPDVVRAAHALPRTGPARRRTGRHGRRHDAQRRRVRAGRAHAGRLHQRGAKAVVQPHPARVAQKALRARLPHAHRNPRQRHQGPQPLRRAQHRRHGRRESGARAARARPSRSPCSSP